MTRKKFIVAASTLVLFAVAFSGTRALASSNTICNAAGVWFAANPTPWGAGTDALVLTCSDGSAYYLYVGASGGACTANIDAVKSLMSLATTARVAGNQLTVFYNTQSCQGLGNVRVLQEPGALNTRTRTDAWLPLRGKPPTQLCVVPVYSHHYAECAS